MKTCTVCGEVKDESEFYSRGNGKSRADCKVCTRARTASYYKANLEAGRASRRAYYQRTRDRWRAYFRDHYRANRDQRAMAHKLWRFNNRDRDRELSRRSQQRRYWRDPAKSRAYVASLAAKRRMSAPGAEFVDRRVVYERDGGICHICGAMTPAHSFHVDHIIPLSRGGRHAYDNVACSCPSCNMRKGNRVP